MHIETTGAALPLAIICAAWIMKLSGPPELLNALAWIMTIVLMLVVVFGGLVVR